MQLSQQVREYLAKNDEEFRRLYEKHQEFEQELEALAKKGFLSPEEEVRVAEVKKKKLTMKDQMLLIAKKHEKSLKQLSV
ncbi:MAG: YdcH family protein [Acidobacteriota bacterium]